MSRGKIAIAWLLGLLLLAAAGLKLYGLSVSTMPQSGWFGQSWVQLLAAEWELVLGLWLLCGAMPKASWFAAVATFLVFAAVSGSLGLDGAESCGCLGAVQTNPWWAFAVDVFALFLLIASRPTYAHDFAPSAGHVSMIGAVAFLLSILTGASAYFFGSPEVAMARLRGESITVDPRQLDFGSGPVATTLESRVELHNWTDGPIHVYGGTSDCTCVATSDLPLTVPAQNTRSFIIRWRLPGEATGLSSRRVELLTDHPRQTTIRFKITCRVSD